jgi:MoaA/NifB/PqqE/SkfB family radical SAM enzyme
MLERYRRDLPIDPPLEGRFLDILMDTSSACQLRCRMCPQALPKRPGVDAKPVSMDEATLQRIVEEVQPHCASLALSCIAEPFVNPRFGRFLEMLEGRGLPMSSLVTNGMVLPDEMLEKLRRAGLKLMSFSLDSPEAEDYQAIRVGGDFQRVVGNIRRLTEFKRANGLDIPKILINCVLMKRNIRQLPRLIELAADLDADQVDLRHVLPIEGLRSDEQSLFDDPLLANDFLDQAAETAQRVGMRLHTVPRFRSAGRPAGQGLLQHWRAGLRRRAKRFVRLLWARPRCAHPWAHLTIHPDGAVYPCPNFVYDASSHTAQIFFPPRRAVDFRAEDYCMGNIGRQSFAEIWSSETARRLRREMMGQAPLRRLCFHCPLRLADETEPYNPEAEAVDVVRDWTC